VVASIKAVLPSIVVELDEKPEPGLVGQCYHVRLPTPNGADYGFTVWLGAGEKQISARLLGLDERVEFWYMPFEKVSYHSEAELDRAFLSTVEGLVRHKTRITQERGLLLHHFTCEYLSDAGWQRIWGLSALRWMRAPRMQSRVRVYESPALVP
jgi:hypothetical protein